MTARMPLTLPILSSQEMRLVTARQEAEQMIRREAPGSGTVNAFQGIHLVVLPGVIPPKADTGLLFGSLPLAPGTSLLDMGSGTGALAVAAALAGARPVLALDINPQARDNTALNARRLKVEAAVESRLSDGFSAVLPEERFDVIAANLPGRNQPAVDLVAAAQWDSGFRTHEAFFAEAPGHLKLGGQVIMVKANYPEIHQALGLAEAAGFTPRVLAEQAMPGKDPRTYYVLGFSLD